MASRSSQRPATGAYSWSPGSTATACTRGGAPCSSPVSGWPWPRLHQSGSVGIEATLLGLGGDEDDAGARHRSERLGGALAGHGRPRAYTLVRPGCSRGSWLTCESQRSDDGGPCRREGEPLDRFDRRTILKSIAVVAAASAFPACGDSTESVGSDADGLARFPQGVASGDPADHGHPLDPGGERRQQPGGPAAAAGGGAGRGVHPPRGGEGRPHRHRRARRLHQGAREGPHRGDHLLLPLQLRAGTDSLPLDRRANPHRARRRRRRECQLRGRQLPGLRGPVLEQLPADAHRRARGARLLPLHR